MYRRARLVAPCAWRHPGHFTSSRDLLCSELCYRYFLTPPQSLSTDGSGRLAALENSSAEQLNSRKVVSRYSSLRVVVVCFETSSEQAQKTRSVHPGRSSNSTSRPLHLAVLCARKSCGFLSTGCATARAVDWLQERGLQPPNSFGLPHYYRERVRTRTRLDSSSPTANPTP